MRFLTRRTQDDPTVNYELIDHAPLEEQAKPVKWETDRTPESLYIRINEISTLYTRGKYTKGLAVQRLLDLLYDINQLHDEAYSPQAKSRYYLLIFNYIYRIRTPRLRLTNAMKRRLIATDQTMYITGVDFSSMSLPGLRIGNALFKDCDFSDSIFQGFQATNCHFENCSFTHANLQGLQAPNSHFEECNLARANLKDVAANACQFIQCRLELANLSSAEFISSSFEGITLTGANLSSSRIARSTFVGCDFAEVISSRGQLPLRVNGCSFLACSFREADLRGADFRNTRMAGCDTLDAKKENARGLT